MAISMSSLRKVRATLPPRILIYGDPGIGKTTLAASFPDPVFIQVEDGTPAGLEIQSWGKVTCFNDVMESFTALYSEKHDRKTLVVDSVTELERFIWAETCARGDDKGHKKDSIESFGYGAGYKRAKTVWQEFVDGMNALRNDVGMNIVLIAHSVVERFDDPESASYSRWDIDLHNQSVGIIERDMDAILLLKRAVQVKEQDQGFNSKRAVAEGGATIFIHTEGRAAFTAKNRYNMPAKIKLEKSNGYAALAPYFPGGDAPSAEIKQAAE